MTEASMGQGPKEAKIMDAQKVDAEIAKLIAETIKIGEETRKVSAEAKYYPIIVAAGLMGAGAALAKLFM